PAGLRSGAGRPPMSAGVPTAPAADVSRMPHVPAAAAGLDSIPAAAPVPPVEWSFNPWRERPARSAAALMVALGCCLVVLVGRESWVLSVALCMAAVATLSPALTPLACRIDDDGVARRGPLGWERRRWSELRRAVLKRAGLRVSPYATRHWLDETRGLFLPLPSAASDALVPSIAPHLARHGF
ncbi:MAG: hypothetical protein ACRDL7_04670, partial [Gaiellaceae bacterium]